MNLWEHSHLALLGFVVSGVVISVVMVLIMSIRPKFTRGWKIFVLGCGATNLIFLGVNWWSFQLRKAPPAVEMKPELSDYLVWVAAFVFVFVSGLIASLVCHKRGYFNGPAQKEESTGAQ